MICTFYDCRAPSRLGAQKSEVKLSEFVKGVIESEKRMMEEARRLCMEDDINVKTICYKFNLSHGKVVELFRNLGYVVTPNGKLRKRADAEKKDGKN